MRAFTDAEVSYLKSQRLGRLATVGADGQPHVVPVGFRYNTDEEAIESAATEAFRNERNIEIFSKILARLLSSTMCLRSTHGPRVVLRYEVRRNSWQPVARPWDPGLIPR